MDAPERDAVELHDDEGGRLNAVWSRSGKRLIVTVHRRGEWAQVELRPNQVEDLAAFMSERRA
jgi:hypothetical protein